MHPHALLSWQWHAAAAPRQVPNSACFQQLQKVKNMRDLAEVCPNIAPGTHTATDMVLHEGGNRLEADAIHTSHRYVC